MAKSEKTIELENLIFEETNKQGTFGCFEVTIGWFGKERVDYMTYDTKGIWRCYEIKSSKSDFYSDSNITFIGHYNYYVMPKELYEQVKKDVPSHIGVYCGRSLIKRPKKQKLSIDEETLKNSMIRSLSREFDKFKKTCDIGYINKLKRSISKLEKENREEQARRYKYYYLIFEICDKYNLNYEEIRQLTRL